MSRRPVLTISHGLRRGKGVRTKCYVGEGRGGVAWLNLNHQGLQQGWPFDGPAAAIHPPIYIEMQQQEGGGDGCGEMGLCACAGGM